MEPVLITIQIFYILEMDYPHNWTDLLCCKRSRAHRNKMTNRFHIVLLDKVENTYFIEQPMHYTNITRNATHFYSI